MKNILALLEGLVFLQFVVWVGYFFIFGICYRITRKTRFTPTISKHRYLVIFPAYREDAVIMESIASFLRQDYPRPLYEVVVVADSMAEHTNSTLRGLGATVLIPDFEKRSKAAALNLAVQYAQGQHFDAAVILDADNMVKPDFLQQMNTAFATGLLAIQAHRIAKNDNTPMAYLDGISEEINNSIFRQGHVNAGLPSALIGSGMLFEFQWFKRTIPKISSVGEDKELEFYLLKDRIYTEYMEHVYVLDEKIQNRTDFSNQRKRWIAAQIDTFVLTLREIGSILRTRNWPLLDKLIQWSIPPRIIILGLLPLWILLLLFVAPYLSAKWIVLYMIFLISLLLAIPNRFYNRRTLRAFLNLPLIFMAILRSFIGLKSARKTFVHTPHGDRNENHSH